jgi:hypothetical protein
MHITVLPVIQCLERTLTGLRDSLPHQHPIPPIGAHIFHNHADPSIHAEHVSISKLIIHVLVHLRLDLLVYLRLQTGRLASLGVVILFNLCFGLSFSLSINLRLRFLGFDFDFGACLLRLCLLPYRCLRRLWRLRLLRWGLVFIGGSVLLFASLVVCMYVSVMSLLETW